jgi:hypothetical protein
VDYINGLAADEKAKVFLLTDYELLKQDLDGLDVVEKVQLAHNILVTSHYASANVRSKSLEHGTRVLPKQLAAEIPIVVNQLATKVEVARYADVIVVDDDKLFAQTLIMFAFSGKVVKHYEDPQQFLANIMHYAKDTKICLDNNFIPSNIKGMEIAKILFEQGYTKLYLLSGQSLKRDEIPEYLTVILKTDIDSIQSI